MNRHDRQLKQIARGKNNYRKIIAIFMVILLNVVAIPAAAQGNAILMSGEMPAGTDGSPGNATGDAPGSGANDEHNAGNSNGADSGSGTTSGADSGANGGSGSGSSDGSGTNNPGTGGSGTNDGSGNATGNGSDGSGTNNSGAPGSGDGSGTPGSGNGDGSGTSGGAAGTGSSGGSDANNAGTSGGAIDSGENAIPEPEDILDLGEDDMMMLDDDLSLLAAGATKQYWYSANSPNTGGGVEWVYTGNTSTTSTTATTVNNWSALSTALDRVGTYNLAATTGDEQPYVILVSGDIAQTAEYTITNKNIILRKAVTSGGTVQKPWNYSTWPYPYPNAPSPDSYDGEQDYTITVSSPAVWHFIVSGGAGTASKLSLENITLDGGGTGKVSGGIEATGNCGGISCAAREFTFSGNITNCVNNSANSRGPFFYTVPTYASTLNIVGGVLSGNCSRIGGGINIWSSSNTTVTINNTIIENNYSFHEGGAIYVGNASVTDMQLTVGNTLIRNNEAWAGSSGISFLASGGTLNLNTGTVISGNESKSTGDKGSSNTYPGNGGAVELLGATTLNVNAGVKLTDNTAWRGGGAISSVSAAAINLYGGEISGNKALGTYRQTSNNAQTDLAIGGGGGIYTAHPELIKIPAGSGVSFSNNSAAFVALTELKSNGDLPPEYTTVFPLDSNYYSHIDPSYQDQYNSAGFPAPYDNLYNNNDIGVPNNLPTAFGKLRTRTTAGGSVTRTVTTANQDFYDVFPNHDWLGLQVGAKATLVATPSPGYFFAGWTRASDTLTTLTTGAGIAELEAAVPAATLGDATVYIKAMPAADLTLTANFTPMPRAHLSGFVPLSLSEILSTNPTSYPTPPESTISLTNSGNANATAVSITIDPASFKKDGLPTGTTPFTVIAGTDTVTSNGGINNTWRILPAANLIDHGNYTATMTLSYNDNVGTVTQTARVSFALIDMSKPLIDLSSHDFGSVVGSRYTVGNGQNVVPQYIDIKNLSGIPANMTVTLAGTSPSAFELSPGAITITSADNSWGIKPKTNLATGTYTAELHVVYQDQAGNLAPLLSVAPVSFTVLTPALLVPNPAVCDFGSLAAGYPLIASQQISLGNQGTADATVTSIVPGPGVSASAFTVIPGNANVSAGGNNFAWSVVPKIGLTTGVYDETFTVAYSYTDTAGPATATAEFSAHFIVGTSNNVTITYNANGGTPTATSAVAAYGGSLSTAPAPAPTRTGYAFTGWYTAAAIGAGRLWVFGTGGSATRLTLANGVVSTASGPTLTLYAHWRERDDYNVTYLNSGISLIPNKVGVKFSDTNLLPSLAPTRPGWTLGGWYTQLISGTQVTAATSYSAIVANDSVTTAAIYAHWTERNDYQVSYNLNGGTSGTIGNKTLVKWADTNLLPGTNPQRTNWVFDAWYTTSAAIGGTQVTAATTYSAIAANDAQTTTTIYARWTDVTPPTATVNYKAKGFAAFMNKITFGLFFRSTVDVVIQGTDAASGMRTIEYLTTDQNFATTAAAVTWAGSAAATWTSVNGATASFSISNEGKRHIFARATDNFGNNSLSFDGFTVYTNSVQTGQSASFTRGSAADITVDVTLNGNTVLGIVNQTEKNAGGAGLVTSGSAWISDVNGGTGANGSITLKNAYLSTLAAGTYTFTVSYNPQSFAYAPDNASDTRNEAPGTTSFTVTVLKGTQTPLAITGINGSQTYTYGDAAAYVGVSGGSGTGSVSYTITPVTGGTGAASVSPVSSASGNTSLSFAKPGTFKIQASKAGDLDFDPVSSPEITVTVNKAVPPVTLTAEARRGGAVGTGTYGDDILLSATVGKVGIGAVPTGSMDFIIDGNSLSSNTVTLNASGQATYTLSTPAAGAHSFEVRYGGNSYYKSYGMANTADADTNAKKSANYTIGKSGQNMTLANPGNKTWGDADFTLSLSAAGAGTGAVTYSAAPSGILNITGNTAEIVGTGSVTITANKAEDSNYNGASAFVTITVDKAIPVWSTNAAGAALTYGKQLSASSLSGGVVKGVGTHASDTLSGIITWDVPTFIPDVTTISGTPAGYAVNFTPTGTDASHYKSITGTANITVGKANLVLKTPLSATPILMNTYGDRLSDSTITGGNTAIMYGVVQTLIPGIWEWDAGQPELTAGFPNAGNHTAIAVFTPADPADTARFNTLTENITVQVFSPKTVITVAPTSSPVRYGDRVSDSVLNAAAATAVADDGTAGPHSSIPGTWSWSVPSDRVNAVGSYPAEILFTPNQLAPNPPTTAGSGYLTSTTMTAITVGKATPSLNSASPGYAVYGKPLSQAALNVFAVTGVFGENVDGLLEWKTPSQILVPSAFYSEVGTYPVTATFTPTGIFATLYEACDFTVNVQVIADTDAIDKLIDDEVTPVMLSLHEDNYAPDAVAAVKNAIAAANAVRGNIGSSQAQADAARADLEAAFRALVHDHPVLAGKVTAADGTVLSGVQTGSGVPMAIVTQKGSVVVFEIKAHLPDLSGFTFGRQDYKLSYDKSGGTDSFAVFDSSGEQIAKITHGSAVVTFNAALLDALGNGDYELRLRFKDSLGEGESLSTVRIAWNSGSGGSTNARTGDDMNLNLWIALALLAMGAIVMLVFFPHGTHFRTEPVLTYKDFGKKD